MTQFRRIKLIILYSISCAFCLSASLQAQSSLSQPTVPAQPRFKQGAPASPTRQVRPGHRRTAATCLKPSRHEGPASGVRDCVLQKERLFPRCSTVTASAAAGSSGQQVHPVTWALLLFKRKTVGGDSLPRKSSDLVSTRQR